MTTLHISGFIQKQKPKKKSPKEDKQNEETKHPLKLHTSQSSVKKKHINKQLLKHTGLSLTEKEI